MREIPAHKFRAQCLAVIRQVQKSAKPVVITKRGKPAAMLICVSDEIFGYMSGKVKIVGDIIRATSSTEDWGNK